MTSEFAVGKRVRIRASAPDNMDQDDGKLGTITGDAGIRLLDGRRAGTGPLPSKKAWLVTIDGSTDAELYFDEDLELIE